MTVGLDLSENVKGLIGGDCHYPYLTLDRNEKLVWLISSYHTTIWTFGWTSGILVLDGVVSGLSDESGLGRYRVEIVMLHLLMLAFLYIRVTISQPCESPPIAIHV